MNHQTNSGSKKWAALSNKEQSRIFTGESYLPLPSPHAERIEALFGIKAVQLGRELLKDVPGYSASANGKFQRNEMRSIADSWNSPQDVQATREWLHRRSVPYSTSIYLVYDEIVVATEWKLLVKYWDAFSWSVGVAMLALNERKSWVCEFHHEDVITFQSYE
ncbi:MAG: hypothetical protein V4673_09125 [Pseudomonadota bacterium]